MSKHLQTDRIFEIPIKVNYRTFAGQVKPVKVRTIVRPELKGKRVNLLDPVSNQRLGYCGPTYFNKHAKEV